MIPYLPTELRVPATVLFGSGTLDRISDAACAWRGRRAWLVLGSRQFGTHGGLADRLISLLNSGGLDARSLTTISREPTIDDVDLAVAQLLEQRGNRPQNASSYSDLIVGVGGGAAMDLAKAVAALVPQPYETAPRSVRDYLEGIGSGATLTAPPLPVIAIPTTAGTGAEATKNAVITCCKPCNQCCKKSLRHPLMIPTLAVIDPELTATLPPERIAGSGMDAITQLIESAISCRANRFTRSLAVAALPDALTALPILYEAAQSTSQSTHADTLRRARESMAYAAFVSGVALANSGLGLAHGVAAALGVHANVPHGVACAMMLPTALRVNREYLAPLQMAMRETSLTSAGQRSYRERGAVAISDGTGIPTAMSDPSETETLEARIVQLNHQLGIPSRLSQVGVTAAMIPAIAKDSKGNSLSGNPISLTEKELIPILPEIL